MICLMLIESKFVFAALIVLALVIIVSAICFIKAICDIAALRKILKRSERDYRFVCDILKHMYKKNFVRAPYLLASRESNQSPHPDGILVFPSGIIIVDSIADSGHILVNNRDNWVVNNNGKEGITSNKLVSCSIYRDKVVALLRNKKIFCTRIKHIVLLTSDLAKQDMLNDDVINYSEIASYVKKFQKGKILTAKEVRAVIDALNEESEINKKAKML